MDPDLRHFGKMDPDLDPHQSGKQDSDPHQIKKQDPDSHQSDADPQHCSRLSRMFRLRWISYRYFFGVRDRNRNAFSYKNAENGRAGKSGGWYWKNLHDVFVIFTDRWSDASHHTEGVDNSLTTWGRDHQKSIFDRDHTGTGFLTWIRTRTLPNVADPDLFCPLDLGSRMGKKSGFSIRDVHPRSFFREHKNTDILW